MLQIPILGEDLGDISLQISPPRYIEMSGSQKCNEDLTSWKSVMISSLPLCETNEIRDKHQQNTQGTTTRRRNKSEMFEAKPYGSLNDYSTTCYTFHDLKIRRGCLPMVIVDMCTLLTFLPVFVNASFPG